MNAVVVCEFSLTVGGWSLQVPCHALLVYIFAPVRTHFAHAFITDNYSHKNTSVYYLRALVEFVNVLSSVSHPVSFSPRQAALTHNTATDILGCKRQCRPSTPTMVRR